MKTIKDKNYSFKHTSERLYERYGLIITRAEYDNICPETQSSIFISAERQKYDIQYVYDINFKNQQIRVVWSKIRNCITTVLPKSPLVKQERRP